MEHHVQEDENDKLGERKFDQALSIRTEGLREWRGSDNYNRYEATPYKALEQLFSKYKLEKTDHLVDFGSGRGRVVFYIHRRFQIPVTGVEAHEITLEEGFRNKSSYRKQSKPYCRTDSFGIWLS